MYIMWIWFKLRTWITQKLLAIDMWSRVPNLLLFFCVWSVWMCIVLCTLLKIQIKRKNGTVILVLRVVCRSALYHMFHKMENLKSISILPNSFFHFKKKKKRCYYVYITLLIKYLWLDDIFLWPYYVDNAWFICFWFDLMLKTINWSKAITISTYSKRMEDFTFFFVFFVVKSKVRQIFFFFFT